MSSKTVLVTGASTGIGRTIARHLHGLGWDVIGTVRNGNDAAALSAAGVTALIVDVTQPESIAAAAKVVAEQLGERGLAALVNNAGIVTGGPVEHISDSDWRRVFDVNVHGVLAVTRAFLPLVRQAKGHIVMMGSVSGFIAAPFVGPYAASKHALEAITQSLRTEVAGQGIRVVSVAPGVIATPIWEKGLAEARAVRDRLPVAARELYGKAMQAIEMRLESARGKGAPPELVAEVVASVLRKRHPKPRYLVGRDARINASIRRMLPNACFDALLRRTAR